MNIKIISHLSLIFSSIDNLKSLFIYLIGMGGFMIKQNINLNVNRSGYIYIDFNCKKID